jgi:hypothetical protein
LRESVGAGIMCAHERGLSLSAMCVPRTHAASDFALRGSCAAAGSTHARSFSRKPSAARGFDVYEMRVAWPARVVNAFNKVGYVVKFFHACKCKWSR